MTSFRPISLALCLLLAAGCGGEDSAAPGSGGGGGEGGRPPPSVVVRTPSVETVTDFLTFTGQIEPIDRVELRPRVTGYLQEVHFEDGQEVDVGDLLFTIDPRPFQAAVAEAEATVAQREAAVAEAQESLDRNERALERDAVSEIAVIQARADLKAAQAQLASAQAALDTAQLDVEYASIGSPIRGRIGRRLVDPGNLVTAGEGEPLAVIVRQTPVYALFPVNERDFQVVRDQAIVGGPDATIVRVGRGEVSPETNGGAGGGGGGDLAGPGGGDEPGYPYRGPLDYLNPEVETGTGTVLMRATLPNDDGSLIPGLFVRVRVPIGTYADALLVPQSALQRDQTGDYLYVVNAQDTVSQRYVTLGPRRGNQRVVLDNLGRGDRVIVEGVQRAQPNAKVSPQQPRGGGEGG